MGRVIAPQGVRVVVLAVPYPVCVSGRKNFLDASEVVPGFTGPVAALME